MIADVLPVAGNISSTTVDVDVLEVSEALISSAVSVAVIAGSHRATNVHAVQVVSLGGHLIAHTADED